MTEKKVLRKARQIELGQQLAKAENKVKYWHGVPVWNPLEIKGIDAFIAAKLLRRAKLEAEMKEQPHQLSVWNAECKRLATKLGQKDRPLPTPDKLETMKEKYLKLKEKLAAYEQIIATSGLEISLEDLATLKASSDKNDLV